MNELISLLIDWGDPATWAAVFGEVDDMRDCRRQAESIRELDKDHQHARHLDQCAEDARLRAIERIGIKIAIENGLRTHSPELLGLVPVVDFFAERPEDLKPFAAAMRDIEGKLRASERVTTEAPVSKDKTFVMASAIWKGRFTRYEDFRKWLESHPEIPNYQDKNKRMVHAVKCLEALSKADQSAFDKLDDGEHESIFPVVDSKQVLEGAARRLSELSKGKRPKK